jgi:C-terminal processing protease CtpA/Prc
MCTGCVVDSLLAGAPASLSKKIVKGDKIVEIDSTSATNSNVIDLLIGSDYPGTIVNIKISREGTPNLIEVALKRACTAELADKKRLFELFTKIKDIATHKADRETGALVDDAIGYVLYVLYKHVCMSEGSSPYWI